jgi:hypothetical protein
VSWGIGCADANYPVSTPSVRSGGSKATHVRCREPRRAFAQQLHRRWLEWKRLRIDWYSASAGTRSYYSEALIIILRRAGH